MRVNKRERNLLWIIMKPSIINYLKAFTPKSETVMMRCDLHMKISKLISHFITAQGGEWTLMGLSDEDPKGYLEIHNWLADNVTNHLDKTIGFPIHQKVCEDRMEEYAIKLFEIIITYMNTFAKLIEQAEYEGWVYNTLPTEHESIKLGYTYKRRKI